MPAVSPAGDRTDRCTVAVTILHPAIATILGAEACHRRHPREEPPWDLRADARDQWH